MHIVKVSRHNLKDLFEMNRVLASEEKQLHLFTADLSQHEKAFLGESPVVSAYLCILNDEAVGFYTCLSKFATYLGEEVLHIEDIYLNENHREKYIATVLNHAIQQAASNKCCRVEMRVLKNYNMGYGAIESVGFRKIEKWDVFRFEGSF